MVGATVNINYKVDGVEIGDTIYRATPIKEGDPWWIFARDAQRIVDEMPAIYVIRRGVVDYVNVSEDTTEIGINPMEHVGFALFPDLDKYITPGALAEYIIGYGNDRAIVLADGDGIAEKLEKIKMDTIMAIRDTVDEPLSKWLKEEIEEEIRPLIDRGLTIDPMRHMHIVWELIEVYRTPEDIDAELEPYGYRYEPREYEPGLLVPISA